MLNHHRHLRTMWLLPFAAAVCGRDHSLVSVVLLVGGQGPFGRDLWKQVRQDPWASVGVRHDCRSVGHSAVVLGC